MKTTAPPHISRKNPLVFPKFSQLIMAMLSTDDIERPNVEDALNELEKVQQEFDKQPTLPIKRMSRRLVYENVFRDPIHGDIPVTNFERKMIDTLAFQRLRRIKQLGTTNLVFHGAEHTRFSHVLGTMHVVEKILRGIEYRTGEIIDVEERKLARAYALLHDLGHIAFGHTLEDEMLLFPRHDDNEKRIHRLLASNHNELIQVLKKEEWASHLLSLLLNDDPLPSPWIQEIVGSDIGADVIDYIDRDAYYCGLDHRVDSALFRWFTISKYGSAPLDKRHFSAIKRRGRKDTDIATTAIFRERLALFHKVYTHPVKISAGAMLGKAISVLLLEKTGIGGLREHDFDFLTDDKLLEMLIGSENEIANSLGGKIQSRQLFKEVYRAQIVPPNQVANDNMEYFKYHFIKDRGLNTFENRTEVEAELADTSQINLKDLAIHCPGHPPGHRRIEAYYISSAERNSSMAGATEMDRHNRDLRAINEEHIKLWRVSVLCDPSLDNDQRKRLIAAAEEHFGLPNSL